MNRADQVSTFKKQFPYVDTNSVNGVLMLQGFINGYNKGQERFQNERSSLKLQIKKLKEENKDLGEQNTQMNQLIKLQDSWMKTGDEHP